MGPASPDRFHRFLTAPRAPENGPTLDSSNEFRIRLARKTVENGDNRSKNGGACISWVLKTNRPVSRHGGAAAKQQIMSDAFGIAGSACSIRPSHPVHLF